MLNNNYLQIHWHCHMPWQNRSLLDEMQSKMAQSQQASGEKSQDPQCDKSPCFFYLQEYTEKKEHHKHKNIKYIFKTDQC